ncbi:hypothetical protein LEN26_014274 [Aphanomyces euteiches]|nr:hypothetical protein AeMF1_017476 [Aphanomyces euteiches]KAH9107508.1 hypothetical protein LEN26_014274 [Aphanomyces euteiches]
MRLGQAVAFLVQSATACTVIITGRNATKNGSVFVAHTEDTGVGAMDLRLVRVPAMDHLPGSMRSIYSYGRSGYPRIVSNERGEWYKPVDEQTLSTPLGYVPQVPHTYAYFDQDYGLINEKQVSIGESSCGAKTVGWALGQPGGENLFSINELTKIALERCDNAKCAIKTMGELAVQYGFYNDFNGNQTHPVYMSSGEALAIGDKYEAWIFHVLTGPNRSSAVWAAQRVPDSHVCAIANGFIIREMNLSDSSNFLASANVHTFAQEMGWWDPTHPFDFTAAYGYSKEGPLLPLYVGRRVWRIMDVFAPSLNLRADLGFYPTVPTYPFSAPPDHAVSIIDVIMLLRDHYEGTPFDLTQGIEAGPWGNPNRHGGDTYGVSGGWERAISLSRTVYSFIHETNAAASPSIGGVTWFALGAPHASVFVPFSCMQEEVPPAYTNVLQSVYDPAAAWWAFNLVNNWLELRFNVIYPEVLAKMEVLQDAAIARFEAIKSKDLDPTTDFNSFAAFVVDQWRAFGWHLVSKYNSGTVVTGEDVGGQVASPYPKWWLQVTSFSMWPGKSLHVPIELDAEKDAHQDVLEITACLAVVSLAGLVAIALVLSGHRHHHGYIQLD